MKRLLSRSGRYRPDSLVRRFLLFASFFFPLLASAYDFEVDGIYYGIMYGEYAVVQSGENRYSGDMVIPDEVEYNGRVYPVRSIFSYAFQDCNELKSIVLPKKLWDIGYAAFDGCSSLRTVDLGEFTEEDDWAAEIDTNANSG